MPRCKDGMEVVFTGTRQDFFFFFNTTVTVFLWESDETRVKNQLRCHPLKGIPTVACWIWFCEGLQFSKKLFDWSKVELMNGQKKQKNVVWTSEQNRPAHDHSFFSHPQPVCVPPPLFACDPFPQCVSSPLAPADADHAPVAVSFRVRVFVAAFLTQYYTQQWICVCVFHPLSIWTEVLFMNNKGR